MGDEKKVLYRIICSPNMANGICLAFLCPECGDIYAIGNYFLKSPNGNILIKEEPGECISCQRDNLPDPIFFQTTEEIQKFSEKCEKEKITLTEFDGYVEVVETDPVSYATRIENSGFYPRA